MSTFSSLHCQDSQVEGKSVLKQTRMIDNLRCANLSILLPALRFVAFTITLLFCSLNTVFACKEIANYLTQNIYSHKDTIYQSPFQLPSFWRIKKHKKFTWHFPLHAFRKILASIPPPSNVSRHFFPFLQRKEQKYLKCTFAVSRNTPIYFMCVKMC